MNYNEFSTAFQVLTYNDVLFFELNQQDPVNNKLYNGGIDAMAFMSGTQLYIFINITVLQLKVIVYQMIILVQLI